MHPTLVPYSMPKYHSNQLRFIEVYLAHERRSSTCGRPWRLWRPSKGGSTSSWHGISSHMAAVRVVKPPWRAATRFPALVSAPGQEVGNVMTLDERRHMAGHRGFGGNPRVVPPAHGMVLTHSWQQYAWTSRHGDPRPDFTNEVY